MDNQSMGTHSEPFFELLQPNTPPITTGSSSSSYVQNGPRTSTFTFNNDDVLPNYDFQPLRTSNGSTSGARIEEAGSSKYRPPPYEVRDPPVTYEKYESSRPRHDLDKDAYDSATTATVERIMKKYADNLLRVLEGISGRLSQLESTTQRLESSLEKVKSFGANNHGEMDGRLRMLENMVREVQRGVQVIRDKQEINEAHMQLKLQQEKFEVPTTKTEVQSPQPVASAPQQPQVVQQQPSVSLPQQPVQQPPPPPPQQRPQTVDVPQPVPVPVPVPAPVPVVQQHHLPPQPVHSAHPPPPQPVPAHQQKPTSYPYPPQNPVQAPPPPPPPHHQQPPYGHQPEAPPYPQPPPHHAQGPPPPGPHHQAPHHQSQGYGVELSSAYNPSYGSPPPPHRPHQHGPPPPMYEPPLQGRTGSGPLALPPPPYAQQQQPPAYETGYGGSSPGNYRLPSGGGGGGGYPHLPTAQPVQQGRQPSRSGVDDVIDKVVAMGFPRDQVRATVQRLTENGQPVDMNVVLDKLMNGAPEPGPPKGAWFGR